MTGITLFGNALKQAARLGVKKSHFMQMSIAAATQVPEHGFDIIETEDAIKILDAGAIGKKAVARVPMKAGTLINEFVDPVLTYPTMHTVQLCDDVHVAPTLGAELINHACSGTNTRIVVDSENKVGRFFTTQDVEEGEDLYFNYNTTEWDMSCPFVCSCPACQRDGPRKVQGFKHLNLEERMEILNETSPLIRAKGMAETLEQLRTLYDMEADGTYFDIKN